jgi:hypothetical protein
MDQRIYKFSTTPHPLIEPPRNELLILRMREPSNVKQWPAPAGVDAANHQLLLTAIHERRLLRFSLDGKDRVAEPHDYGIKAGVVRLLTYQISGASSGPLPGWRWIDVSRISDVEPLNKTFAGGRASSGKHHTWDILFARVDHS